VQAQRHEGMTAHLRAPQQPCLHWASLRKNLGCKSYSRSSMTQQIALRARQAARELDVRAVQAALGVPVAPHVPKVLVRSASCLLGCLRLGSNRRRYPSTDHLSHAALWPRCVLRSWEFVEGSIVSETCVACDSCRSKSLLSKVSAFKEGSDSMVR